MGFMHVKILGEGARTRESDSAQQEWRSALEVATARRRILEAEFSHQPPLLIEIIPTARDSATRTTGPNQNFSKPNLSLPSAEITSPP
jgi:hypothetical protein